MSQADVKRWIEGGDLRRAASSLVVAYGSDVLATCIAMVRDRAAAEDVTQEVFGEALRALATFRGESSPRTWLLSIARNRCIDHLRARKRDPWAGAPDEGAADPDAHPDQGAPGSEWLADRSVVMRALDALAEGDRALIVLRFKNGLEYGELATAFGLREGTVRMRVSRALARMRQVLESDAPVMAGAPMAAPAFAHTPAARGAVVPAAASAPAQAAARQRAPLPVPRSPGAPPAGGAFGAPPAPARSSVSWWSRLRSWAGLGDGAEPPAPQPETSRPVGALGLALAACEPAMVSEALAARLAALVTASRDLSSA
jgi:RNA polymerase sigma-70 factor (ECF subfamily)